MKTILCTLLIAISFNSYAAPKVLATVNGAKITQAAVENYMSHVKSSMSFQSALATMITIEVLASERLRTPLKPDSPLQLELDRNRKAYLASDTSEMLLKGFNMTDEQIKTAYQQQYLNEAVLKEYNASHILVKTKQQADELIQQLKLKADFSALAKQHSTGPSGKNGGSLGWFNLSKMVKPFSAATASLTKNNVSDPVQTQFGWHIIKLNDVRKTTAPSLDSVTKKITNRFAALKLNEEIEKLISAANIVINQP